ncbi:endonuclease/exonuclease/phosphatase family protein [Flavobacterium amniphilum]|uniref:endonuclease/exonuclease/phosphatase family protein n=1 Tax=Flavobacterium amniphilum TaxID=1834035 RepID=UPI00202A8FEB|nr:endonuclease/exonuclease/phosphatase family protein [Flavobacterium amniphilum]MCL9804478.1 endonuclease/exonuclease/phosphatase family protein [Flavobacterium amniphilum]
MSRFYTYLVIILLFLNSVTAQIKLCSWNIENIGKSKSDQDIEFMATTLKDFDVVALQEVVAGYGGAQAVAKLAEALNRKGSKWDYVVSNPTTGSSYKTERYAFLWKTSLLKLKGAPWLEKKYQTLIDREPFYATFKSGTKEFTLANFHAITKSKQPETEIKYFKNLPSLYPDLNLLFVGDFNCPQSHSVFTPLKSMGYTSAFRNQKTSLKKTCQNDNCLASEFDNIWYKAQKTNLINKQAIHFYKKFQTLEEARKISDHIPISIVFSLN